MIDLRGVSTTLCDQCANIMDQRLHCSKTNFNFKTNCKNMLAAIDRRSICTFFIDFLWCACFQMYHAAYHRHHSVNFGDSL